MDDRYFPSDGTYAPFPGIYATWLGATGAVPNPCRKYHVSSNVSSAREVAEIALPLLRAMNLHHKVVQSRDKLSSQQTGPQAGKFITIYAPPSLPRDRLVGELGGALAARPGLRPGPTVPRSRVYHHVFAEMPLDEGMLIYGGVEVDPYE